MTKEASSHVVNVKFHSRGSESDDIDDVYFMQYLHLVCKQDHCGINNSAQ